MKKILTLCAVLLVAATTFAQAPRYGIKSGTYKTEMDMMGQTITNTVYFDDFGAKEATSMSMMGMEMTQINKDGKMYLVNKGEKSVQEMVHPRNEPDGPDRQGDGLRLERLHDEDHHRCGRLRHLHEDCRNQGRPGGRRAVRGSEVLTESVPIKKNPLPPKKSVSLHEQMLDRHNAAKIYLSRSLLIASIWIAKAKPCTFPIRFFLYGIL